ncbi:MAG: choice-of-anchor D domain-containing protein [Spirochaetales bacterium]|nr:choice-of-anchor D domain-containing protein [Spirochaetales bacterium]
MMKKFFSISFFFLLFFLWIPASYSQTLGDSNNDGRIDIVDALLIAQYYVGLNPQGIDTAVMDVNVDGSIDIIDALLVAQYYVGLISEFPGQATPGPTGTPTPLGSTDSPPPASTSLPTAAGTSMSTPAGDTPTPGAITPTPDPGGTPMPETTPDPDETDFFYFSYDDSASTAAVELVKYKLNNGEIPDPGLARPWEFLNFEEFNPVSTTSTGLFNVSMGLWERDALKDGYDKAYKLGVYCASPFIPKEERENIVLTLLVDVSGSMSTQSLRVDNQVYTRMDLVHYGLNVLPESLKDGDIINIATFQTTAEIRHQGLQYPADLNIYYDAVENLIPSGSTNLADGIDKAYQVALATYDSEKTNRVVILTDAYANTGQIDPSVIAQNVIINNEEGIYFSGLGISEAFNEAFLNELTDAGKGAYFSIVTQTDAQRAFKDRFIALLSIAAKDVQFRMDYPVILEHDVTAAEETSGDPSEVQTTNFSYNTSQYFFEGFLLETGVEVLPEAKFKLTISYKDPADGTQKEEVFEKTITELLGVDLNLIRDAETIFLFTKLFGLQKTWGEICPVFTIFYEGYSSPIYTEYRDLMKKFIGDTLKIIPDPVNFGTIPEGESITKTVTIANNTINPVDIYNISFENPDSPNPFSFTVTIPATIPSMDVLNFQVSFSPDTAGSFTKTLLIDWSFEADDYELVLSGTSETVTPTPTPSPIPDNNVVINPDPVDCGEVVVGNTLTSTVVITNNTSNPVEIYNIYFENTDPPNPFHITVTLPSTIPAGSYFSFQVTFSPESEGNFNKVLMIDWSYTSGNYALNVLGTGLSEANSPTPTPTINPATPVPTPA